MSVERILVVDDRDDSRYLLRVMLQGNGYVVDEARHGAEALALARRNPPNLVISDILMPEMDGFSLCRHWQEDERLRTIPFIFYTATYTDPRDRELALSLGAARFIVKPEDPERFVAIVRETIHGVGEEPAGEGPMGSLQLREDAFLRRYNEALVRKLEAKLEELQATRCALEERLEELRRTEEALRASEARYRALFEHMATGACLGEVVYEGGRAVDYRILEVNPAFIRLHGLRREEAINALGSTVHGPDVPHLEVFARVAETGEPACFEAFFPGLDLWLDVSVSSPARGMFLAMLADNTARKQAEEEAARSLEELRRWHVATLGREARVMELKREVNELLHEMGRPPRYGSVDEA